MRYYDNDRESQMTREWESKREKEERDFFNFFKFHITEILKD